MRSPELLQDLLSGLNFGLFFVFSLFLIWNFNYLPMVDLPQFSGLVYMLANYWSSPSHYDIFYPLNYSSPYFLTALAGALLAQVMPVTIALKVLITLIVIAIPCSVYLLLRQSGSSTWWSVLSCPLAFGFCFHWGLISFMAALPLLFIVLVQIIKIYEAGQTKRKWTALVFSLLLLLFIHGYVFLLALIFIGLIHIFKHRSPKVLLTAIVSSLAIGGLLYIWLSQGISTLNNVEKLIVWGKISETMLLKPWLLVGNQENWINTILAMGILLVPFTSCAKPCFRWSLCLPFLAIFLLEICGPSQIGWLFYLQERQLILLPLLLWLPLRQSMSQRRLLLAKTLTLGLLISWFTMQTHRFASFNQETEGFNELISEIKSDKHLLYFSVDANSAAGGEALFLHFAAWSQTYKGGVLSYSFALFPSWPLQPLRKFDAWQVHRVWSPFLFWWHEDRLNDYYVVRAAEDASSKIFKEYLGHVRLLKHFGNWWLYEPIDRETEIQTRDNHKAIFNF